jgi:hypothetical protein
VIFFECSQCAAGGALGLLRVKSRFTTTFHPQIS